MMERLGVTIAQAHIIGWRNVAQWARHLDESSATYRAIHPEEASFASALGRAALAADQFDAIMALGRLVASAHGARGVRQAKPYPRPWAKDKDETKFGSDPIPASEFNDWYYSEEA